MKKAGMAMVLLTMAVFHVFSADDVVFSEGFDTPEAVAKYGPGDGISFVPEGGAGGSGCIRFHRDTVGDSWLLIPIDPAELRGRAIQVEAMMKAEKIAKPSPGYMGPKLMLNLQSPGENSHSEQEKVHGTYDWRKFQVFAQAASDVEKAVLAIGIQHGQGTLYMDDVKITLVPTGETEAFVPPAAPLPTRTKYRGMMSGYDLREADIRDFALDFGGNLLRWQLLRGKADTSTPELYRAWLDAELDKLDAVMPALKKYGVKVAIDLHGGPGTNQDRFLTNQLSWDVPNQNLFVETWEKIARRYKGNPMIYGYDLLNEPVAENYVRGVENPWLAISERLVRVIREVDPDTPIITEPDFANTRPLADRNVIYSPHFYSPHAYTHQGGLGQVRWSYPGVIDGVYWDKEQLRVSMKEVIEFQKKHGVPIFVGEFSVINWAKGGDRYLADMIELFEEYGWDWAYHAFREWDAWSIEHEGKAFRSVVPSPDNLRKRVLLEALKKNTR